MTDWKLYLKCTEVCFAEAGKPCLTLSGRNADGDRVVVEADEPHSSRKLRSSRPNGAR